MRRRVAHDASTRASGSMLLVCGNLTKDRVALATTAALEIASPRTEVDDA